MFSNKRFRSFSQSISSQLESLNHHRYSSSEPVVLMKVRTSKSKIVQFSHPSGVDPVNKFEIRSDSNFNEDSASSEQFESGLSDMTLDCSSRRPSGINEKICTNPTSCTSCSKSPKTENISEKIPESCTDNKNSNEPHQNLSLLISPELEENRKMKSIIFLRLQDEESGSKLRTNTLHSNSLGHLRTTSELVRGNRTSVVPNEKIKSFPSTTSSAESLKFPVTQSTTTHISNMSIFKIGSQDEIGIESMRIEVVRTITEKNSLNIHKRIPRSTKYPISLPINNTKNGLSKLRTEVQTISSELIDIPYFGTPSDSIMSFEQETCPQALKSTKRTILVTQSRQPEVCVEIENTQ
ncbi:hypothetical protein HK096_006908, partial [Nowakowskiella sp. JEL0078]